MAKLLVHSSRRLTTVCCLTIILAATAWFGESQAQLSDPRYVSDVKFSFNLEDVETVPFGTTLFDTVSTIPLNQLQLGEYYRVPNFLDTDFSRTRRTTEYLGDGAYQVTITHPNTVRFTQDEARQGVYFVYTPRDFTTPGVDVELEPIDAVAEDIRRESLREVWRVEVVTAINTQKVDIRGQDGGLLNINIPVNLPDPIEKIIGKGEETNIDISGRESITFSGTSRVVDPFVGSEGQQKQSLFPSLDLRQELDVRLNGQIGEKIFIQVDHSSTALPGNSNRIRLHFQGFEDDVIQRVELGNTNLSLPGSQLVNFSAASQGLFGIKVIAQFGAMDLTMIASKEEGEASTSTFTPSGGTLGQAETRVVRDIDFIRDTFFFLDHPFATDQFGNDVFYNADPSTVELYERVSALEVSIANANPDPDNPLIFVKGRAFVDSLGTGQAIRDAFDDIINGRPTADFQESNFKLLEQDRDYRFILDADNPDLILGIEMLRPIAESGILAAQYVNAASDTTGFRSVTLIDDLTGLPEEVLLLEVIKPQNPRHDNAFGYTWPYMMRHIYNLGLSNIDQASFQLEIRDNANRLDTSVPDGSTVPWIRIFGLDQTDGTGLGLPDARVDLSRGVVDLQRGLLIFPTFRPFDPTDDLVSEWTDSLFSFTNNPNALYQDIRRGIIYDEKLPQPEKEQRFIIEVTAVSSSRSFQIDAFNITPNSEIVRIDGRALQRGRDYSINYDTGEVELQGDVLDELTPSSNITIDYEFTPFGGTSSSTLAGFHSLLNLGENSKIGTTWLYESKATASERPRLGEEPTRAIVGDVNANFQLSPGILTDIVNILPLVSTDDPSQLTLGGEIAASLPDPNTQGEVFIDDFEGVEDSDLISLLRRSWQQASTPLDPEAPDSLSSQSLEDTLRVPTIWYNIEPERGVTRRDHNPDLDQRESTLMSSLDIEFRDKVPTDNPDKWVGVMTGFRGAGLDLSQGQFLEVWVNDFKGGSGAPPKGGTLHIDFGFISEDFFDPGAGNFNQEDRNRDGFNASTEDTGLDGIPEGFPGDAVADDFSSRRLDASLNPDENGKFLQINGTESNFLPDSEDLDGSGQLDQINAYFTIDVNLASAAEIDVRRDFVASDRWEEEFHEKDSWRLYRIKLSDARIRTDITQPIIEQITHMRVWFDSIATVVDTTVGRIQLADLKIVGNRWEQDGVRSADTDRLVEPIPTGTNIGLGIISTKSDPTRYNPPFLPNQVNDIFDKEQSLLVNYENLESGDGFRLRKRFSGRGQDWTQYRDVQFFVHTDQFDSAMEYYFQVAFDSLNFYEIQAPLTPSAFSSGGWAHVHVSLPEITSIKFEPIDSIRTITISDIRDPAKSYTVKMVGNPNLFNVRFLYAGLRNKSSDAKTGELWLDDILLGDRKRDLDFAARGNLSVNMANVINFNLGWQRTGPDFRGLRQARGSGSERQNINMNLKSNVRHFLPTLGFSIPVSGNFGRSVSLPKFTPNSDTELLAPQLRDSLRTETTTRGLSATLTKSGSRFPPFRWVFDKTRLNYSVSQRFARSPSARDTTLSMAGTLDYQNNFGNKPRIKLIGNTFFRFFPNTLNFRADAQSRETQRWRNVGGSGFVPDPKVFDADLNLNGGVTYIPFASLTSSWRGSMRRDVNLPQELWGVNIGQEVARTHNFQASFRPPRIFLLKEFQPDFSYNSGYSEDSSPNVQRTSEESGVRNFSANRDVSGKIGIQIGKYLRKIFGAIGMVEEEEPPAPGGAGGGTAPADSTAPKRSFDPFKRMGTVFSNIRRINVSARQRVGSNYSRLQSRPGYEYQFGLSQDTGIVLEDGTKPTPERINRTVSITMDSGVQISSNIDVAARFANSTTNTTFINSVTKSESRTFPDLSLSWGGLENFGPLRGLFQATNLTMGWTETVRRTGRGGEVDSENKSRQITPSLVFTWKNGVSTSVATAFRLNTADTRGSVEERSSRSVSVDMRYTFQAGKFKLPFSSRQLQSTLDTNLNVTWATDDGRRFLPGALFPEPIPGSSRITVSPRATYAFSRALNGSAFVNYSRVFRESVNQTTTTVEVGIQAILQF